MNAVTTLKGIALIEKDVNGDLVSWHFPVVETDIMEVLKARCGLLDKVEPLFRFSRFKNSWQYMLNALVDPAKSTKIHSVCVVLLSEVFNPKKFQALLEIMVNLYLDKQSPIPLLEVYLSVFSKGEYSGAAGSYVDADHDDRVAMLSSPKELVSLFGADSILIWIAMLLKKRIFVYSDKLSDLLTLVRAFPVVGAWHRQNSALLRPFMNLTEAEQADLSATGVYVAGFTDPACVDLKDLFDLYVDVSARVITVPEHAKGDFVLTKFHNDLAEGFVATAEKEDAETALAKEIALKTKDLLTNLQSLKEHSPEGLTLEDIQKLGLPPNLDTFFFNVAQAEGLTKQ